jgi:hypothetical protein
MRGVAHTQKCLDFARARTHTHTHTHTHTQHTLTHTDVESLTLYSSFFSRVRDERHPWERPLISTCSTRRPLTARAATRAAEGKGEPVGRRGREARTDEYLFDAHHTHTYSPGGRMVVEGPLRQVSISDDDGVEGLEIVRGETMWSPTRRQKGGKGSGEGGHVVSHGLRVSVSPREAPRQRRPSTPTTSNRAKNQEIIATSVISLDLDELGKTEGRERGGEATRSRAGGRSPQGMDEEGGRNGGGGERNVPDQRRLETERRAHMLRKNQVCVCMEGGGSRSIHTLSLCLYLARARARTHTHTHKACTRILTHVHVRVCVSRPPSAPPPSNRSSPHLLFDLPFLSMSLPTPPLPLPLSLSLSPPVVSCFVCQRPEWYRPILRLGINTIRKGRSGKSVMVCKYMCVCV